MTEPESMAEPESRDDTLEVKLMKMSKGYQWEITFAGTDEAEVLKRIASVDSKLREQYQGGE